MLALGTRWFFEMRCELGNACRLIVFLLLHCGAGAKAACLTVELPAYPLATSLLASLLACLLPCLADSLTATAQPENITQES